MNQKSQRIKEELQPLLQCIQRSDFKGTETRLQQLSPMAALEALTVVWQELKDQGQRRRRLLWLTWLALTLLLTGGCTPCMTLGGKFDPTALPYVLAMSTLMAGIATWLLSLFARPNLHGTKHYLRETIERTDSTQSIFPLLILAALPGLSELHSPLWLRLAQLLPRLSDDDIFALTPEQRALLLQNCERHGTNLTLAVILIFTSLKDPRLKDRAERWLRFPDERLQEATRDYLKAIE